jgi:ABC-2 type transport system permease protein
MNKIGHIIVKEIRHILRDARSLVIAILMPIMMTLLYGYAINLDIKNIRLAILDYDRTVESRELAGRFFNSGYFVRALAEPDMADPEKVLKAGKAHAVLTIRPGLAHAMIAGNEYQLGMLIDGADANTSAAAAGYGEVILYQFLIEQLPPGSATPGIVLSQQILYNPDLKSSHFFVPGLIAVILMMISALLTSITIAREKETGTLEQLLTSPVKPYQIIIGKVIPYIGLAVLDGALILLFAVFHFGVPFTGSIALLFAFGIIYVIAALSLGILISTISHTQQQAMMGAQLLTVLPSVMLSGFIFEVKNMPTLLQYMAHLIPAKYFLLIIRGIMLKGSGIEVLWPQAAAMVVITVVLLGVASKRFTVRIG